MPRLGPRRTTLAWVAARNRGIKAERALREVIEAVPDGFVLWDENDRLVTCNAAFRQVYSAMEDTFIPGVPFEDLIRLGIERGQYPAALGREEEFVREVVANHRACRTVERQLIDDRWIRIREARTPSGSVVGSRADITDLKSALAEAETAHVALAHQAGHDPLTDLPNRRRFLTDLALALRRGGEVAVLNLDLDGFKPVNDTHGHAVGDALLKEVACRLREVVPEGATVARLGGDEFAVVLTGSEAARALAVGRDVVEGFGAPFELRVGTVRIGVSVGVAAAAADDAAHLLDRADEAMYAAKRGGGCRVEVWKALPAAASSPTACIMGRRSEVISPIPKFALTSMA